MTNTPAVGTLFTVPRKSYSGSIVVQEYRVTAVRQGKIYYVDTRGGSEHRNRPVNMGLRADAVIVSVPDKAAKTPNPKLGKRQIDALYAKAHKAGLDAGQAANPTPMVVESHSNPFNDASPVVQSWYVSEGACGFASIKFPANTAFAHRLIERGLASKSCMGGAYVWVGEFGQSVDRKAAYAGAFAKVLTDAGIQKVYAESRLD